MSSFPYNCDFVRDLHQLFCRFPSLHLSNCFLMIKFKLSIFFLGGETITSLVVYLLQMQMLSLGVTWRVMSAGSPELAVGCASEEDPAPRWSHVL